MYRIIGADGREYGPISADQLRQWIAESRANAATRVLTEGATEWRALGTLPEFSLLFASAAPAGVPVVFSTTPIRKNNAFAIIGFVLGIVSLTFGLCCCYGIPLNFLGLIFSIIGLVQINSEPERYAGKGLAIAGLVLCLVSILLAIGLFIVVGLSGNWSEMTNHAHRL
jgi:hypothetical protein